MEGLVLPWAESTLQEGYFTGSDGMKIHYHYAVHPQEQAAIVISHGFCEFVCKYYEIMYYFYQMGYSVFFLEYRGHGFSQRYVEELDKVHVRDYQEYVEDLHDFMECVVVEKSLTKTYVLFAHSMGGCVATLFLEQYPHYFKKAVLSAPLLQMNFRKVPDWQVSLLMVWCKIAHWDLRYAPGQKGFDNVYVFDTSSCTSEARYAYIFSQRQQEPHYTSYGGTYGWVRASVKAIRRAHKEEAKIRIPILLFQAGLDGMVKPEGQEAFVRETGQTELVRYENSKHEIFNATADVRQDYYKRIFEFLKSL
jgi:lysophospholipase